MLGVPPTPAIFVRFKDGVIDVTQEDIIEMLLNHPGFRIDYIPADEEDAARFQKRHTNLEPQHVLIKMDNGRPGGQIGSKAPAGVSPEMMDMLKGIAKDMAVEMAKELAPKMAVEMASNMIATKSGQPGVTTAGLSSTEPMANPYSATVTTSNDDPLAQLESLEETPVGRQILAEPGDTIEKTDKRKNKTK